MEIRDRNEVIRKARELYSPEKSRDENFAWQLLLSATAVLSSLLALALIFF